MEEHRYHNIYLKRISSKQSLSEIVTFFFAISLSLLFLYCAIKYVETNHSNIEENKLMKNSRFAIEIDGNIGKIKLKGDYPWQVYSSNASAHCNHRIEQLKEDTYLLTYFNTFDPEALNALTFKLTGKTITLGTPCKMANGDYINLTKSDAERLFCEIN